MSRAASSFERRSAESDSLLWSCSEVKAKVKLARLKSQNSWIMEDENECTGEHTKRGKGESSLLWSESQDVDKIVVNDHLDYSPSRRTDDISDNVDESETSVSPTIVLEKDDEDLEKSLQDSGWAWLVALGCFLSHVITGGLERTDGVFFIKLTSHFQSSAQVTAWAGALTATVMLSMGPLAGAVCSRFSARASVMVGAVLYTAGLVFSGLAPNMPTLLFFFGVVQGLGRGLAYAPGLILVGMYFNRLRGVAVGLSTAGVGAGTFLLPPVVEMLFETYGFFGAFFILGGIALHFFVVAFLYRPLFLHRKIVLTGRRRQTEALLENEKRRDVAELPQTVYDKSEQNTANALPVRNASHTPPPAGELLGNPSRFSAKGESMVDDTVCVSSVSSRKSHFLKSFLRTCFPVEKKATGSKRRKLMHWSLLKQPAFVLYCLSMCLLTASMKSSIVFLPPLAKSRGVSETNAAYLLSISGVADTVGRVLTGVVLELSIVRPYRPMAFSSFLFAIGALAFASPFLSTFSHFTLAFAFFGFFTGACAGLKSVILVDLLGQETLSSSFGIMSFFQGVGNFVGPPLSGVLKDVFDQYDEAFYLGGGAMTVAGIFMVISNVYTVSYRARHRIV